MHFLRFVAGPIAAGLLMLAPTALPALAQPAPQTADDIAFQASFTTATTGVTDLLAQKDVIDARIAAADANTDYVALAADIKTVQGQWQAVTDRIVQLSPTPRYLSGTLSTVTATQTFATAYGLLADAFTNRDGPGLVGAMSVLTTAKGMMNDAGVELQAA